MPNSSSDDLTSASPPNETARRDLNTLKRNMTIAKGFLDVSLLSANANQLRNIINYGDTTSGVYYVVFTGIIFSLILQVAAGVIMIVAERFDIEKEEDDEWSDLMNTVVVCIIFVVLLLNVFVSSFGVDVANPFTHTTPPSVLTTTNIQDLAPKQFS